MGTICATCGTENRALAKFCIECIATLPTSFAPTEFSPRAGELPRRSAPSRAPSSVGVPPVSRATLADAPAAGGAGETRSASNKGLWVSVASLAIALFVGAVGWLIAGAGGWYIYSAGATGVVAKPAMAEPAASAVPLPVEAAPPVAAPAVMELPKTRQENAAEQGGTLPTAPSAPTPRAAAPGVVMPRPPAPAETRTPSKARPAPDRQHALAGDPEKQCAGLGFFAAAHCMAAQCATPAHGSHPKCEAVRRQQRLMEDKRNPTLAN